MSVKKNGKGTLILFWLGLALILSSIILYTSASINYSGDINRTAVTHSDRNLYIYQKINIPFLPGFLFTVNGDSNSAPTISRLQLKEDGKPLDHPHAVHTAIAEIGKGQYSHWSNAIYFSSSDNTDPRQNGRTYSFTCKLYPRFGILLLMFLAGFILIGISIVLKKMNTRSAPSTKNTEFTEFHTHQSPSPRTGSRTKLKNFAFMLIAIVITVLSGLGCLLIVELATRYFYPVDKGMLVDSELFKYHPYLAHTHPTGVKLGKSKNVIENYFSHSPETDSSDGYTCKFNSLGFRSGEFADIPPKEKNEIRIIITGGSASISWNIGEKGKLEVLMEEILRKRFPEKKFTFFNLGNGAWISIQELFAIELYSFSLSPDFIIAYDGFNDAQHAVYSPINTPYTSYMKQASQRMEKWIKGGVFDFFESWKAPGFVKKFFSNQIILTATLPVAEKENYKAPELPEKAAAPKPGSLWTKPMGHPLNMNAIMLRTDFDPYNQQVVDNYLKNMALMGSAAGLSSGKLIVALQPALIFKTPLSECERKILTFSYGGEANFIALCYERMWQGLQKLSREKDNISIIDLRAPFSGMPENFFGDNVHISLAGNKIVAARLANFIAEELRRKEQKQNSEKQ